MKPLVTVKITPKARQLLRFVAAMRGERQYHIVERLLQAKPRKPSGTKDRYSDHQGQNSFILVLLIKQPFFRAPRYRATTSRSVVK
jgi:hypothetical protein